MGLRETEKDTEKVLERMEDTLNSIEQMSFDSINITDKLVALTSEAKEHADAMKAASKEERNAEFMSVCRILDQIQEITLKANHVVHGLERETMDQRDTTAHLRQIIDFLYAMTDEA